MLGNSQCVNRVDSQYSRIYDRSNGLPQGGISSPILFNLYINDLIEDLNKTGISVPIINNYTLNNLLFADDIVIFAESKEQLNALLDTCTQHLEQWELTMNLKKSKILTKEFEFNENKLNELCIKLVTTTQYKYLGIPFGPTGINHNKYLKKIKTNFVAASKSMHYLCNHYNIPRDQRVNIYKTVIRSQLEYGAQVIDYTNPELLQELEKLQLTSLRCLLHIPSTTPDAAILISTDILTIENRFNELKLNFFMKQRTSESLAGRLVRTLLEQGQSMKPYDNNDIPFPYHKGIKDIFTHYGSVWRNTMYYPENEVDTAVAKSFINITIHNYNYRTLLPQLDTNKKAQPILQSFYQPTDDNKFLDFIKNLPPQDAMDNMLAQVPAYSLQRPRFHTNLIPSCIRMQTLSIWRDILLNLPYNSHHPQICLHCKETATYPYLHNMFQCEHTRQHRLFIINQLSTHFRKHSITQHPILDHLHDLNNLDTPISDTDLVTFLQLLFNMKDNCHTSQSIIHSLCITLAYLSNHTIYHYITPIEWINIDGTTQADINDFIENKLLVLIKHHNDIMIQETGQLPRPSQLPLRPYFGSASNRTALQKQAATEYVSELFARHRDDIIVCTDGSYFHKYNNPTSGCAMIASHAGKITVRGALKLDTRSSAIAEFAGIIYCLRWLEHSQPAQSKNVNILVDCQYVVNVCTQQYNYNSKHTIYVQTIRALLSKLKSQYNIQFHWIPGHTNNYMHTETDRLARQAAVSQKRIAINTEFTLNYFTDELSSGWVWPYP